MKIKLYIGINLCSEGDIRNYCKYAHKSKSGKTKVNTKSELEYIKLYDKNHNVIKPTNMQSLAKNYKSSYYKI